MIKKADVFVEEFMVIFNENEVGKLQRKDDDTLERLELTAKDKKDALVTAALSICQRLIGEIKDIADMRRAKSDIALEAIVKEQDRKWKAIVRRLDGDKLPLIPHPDAFQMVWGQLAKRR